MLVMSEANFDSVAADGVITEQELLDNNKGFHVQNRTSTRAAAVDDDDVIRLACLQDNCLFTMDELRVGTTLEDVFPLGSSAVDEWMVY